MWYRLCPTGGSVLSPDDSVECALESKLLFDDALGILCHPSLLCGATCSGSKDLTELLEV